MQGVEMARAKPLSRAAGLRGAIKPEPIADLSEVIEGSGDVGREIKLLRRASDVTLAQLAEATGLSQGYLSQVERGKSSPSVKALHTISRALGVNISWFFKPQRNTDDALTDLIVRREMRRRIEFESGIIDELLSPNLGRGIELLRCTFPPGSASGPEPYEHRGEETGLVLEGCLSLWLDGRKIMLETGDSFAFESDIPHRYMNEGDIEAVVIWAISPPSY
jgi:transcriptional regulator with XRE-family HTH domain